MSEPTSPKTDGVYKNGTSTDTSLNIRPQEINKLNQTRQKRTYVLKSACGRSNLTLSDPVSAAEAGVQLQGFQREKELLIPLFP